MQINFAPDYITCCCLLYNLLICSPEIDVEQIVIVLDEEVVATQNFITQGAVVTIEDGKTSSEQ
jgi:low affinity Fe/Cu permease